MPIEESITIVRAEDITLHMTEVRTDITGWVISFTVSMAPNDPVKMFQVTAIGTVMPQGKYDIIIVGGIGGQSDIEPGTYYYDISRVNPGNLRCLRLGEFVVKANARSPV